jgi:hypothetical protein
LRRAERAVADVDQQRDALPGVGHAVGVGRIECQAVDAAPGIVAVVDPVAAGIGHAGDVAVGAADWAAKKETTASEDTGGGGLFASKIKGDVTAHVAQRIAPYAPS